MFSSSNPSYTVGTLNCWIFCSDFYICLVGMWWGGFIKTVFMVSFVFFPVRVKYFNVNNWGEKDNRKISEFWARCVSHGALGLPSAFCSLLIFPWIIHFLFFENLTSDAFPLTLLLLHRWKNQVAMDIVLFGFLSPLAVAVGTGLDLCWVCFSQWPGNVQLCLGSGEGGLGFRQ